MECVNGTYNIHNQRVSFCQYIFISITTRAVSIGHIPHKTTIINSATKEYTAALCF